LASVQLTNDHLKAALFFLLVLFGILQAFAQNADLKSLGVWRKTSEIKLDGILNDEAWKTPDSAFSFTLNSPNDTATPTNQTIIKMVFDDKFLYIGAKMMDTSDRPYIIQSLRRDWSFGRTDNVSLYFDTYNDQTNGFTFGSSPYGVQREGTVFFGRNVAPEWENIWYLESKRDSGGWTAEFKIPFKSIRYKNDLKSWNLSLLRYDLKNNETSTWNFVPRQFRASNLAFSGKILWKDPLPKPGHNISLIPFVAARGIRDYLGTAEEEIKTSTDAGGDIKIGIGTALNLDLTFNPDYSQVEVDVQQTNLTRFELFFPERRQFFLENNDLFGKFGYPNSRIFFSRRIGLQKPIVAGARLSGKLNEDLRIGFLNMQEGGLFRADTNDNYTVALFQQKVFARSNIQGIFVNRQGFRFYDVDTLERGSVEDDYNRAYGLEYNLFSGDGKWTGDFFLMRSETTGKMTDNWGQGAFLNYQSRNFSVGIGQQFIGKNYQLDVGFLPRTAFQSFNQFANYDFYVQSKKLISHGPAVNLEHIYNPAWKLTDQNVGLSYSFVLLNTSEFGAFVDYNFIYLQNFFKIGSDPGDLDSLPANTDYRWTRYGARYQSDQRKKFTYNFRVSTGGFYSADWQFFRTEIGYRFQPFGSINFNVEYNFIDLSGGGKDGDLWLVGPRLDLTFSRKVFLSAFFQLNDQFDNFNINARLQYRFRPVSDFFIVYTENYFGDYSGVKNRAIVLKLTYWFNI
jgi:Domain of unknown function (DUF5916)/Carbohydrate family 9 binding domain-like